jgi:hypothetical protein
MDRPPKFLTRWKHIEVIYQRLCSGGLSAQQRERLRGDLEHALQLFDLADLCQSDPAGVRTRTPHTPISLTL